MKRIAVAVLALAVCAAVAVPAFAATKTIAVGDTFFVRSGGGTKTVAVKKNTTVTWKWVRTNLPHDVKVTSGPVKFTSKITSKKGFTYSRKMTRTGTYKIICTIHPGSMKLTLKVT